MNDNSNLSTPFYKKITLDFTTADTAEGTDIKYNLYQYAGYYSLVEGIEITSPIKSQAEELIWKDIIFNTTYYEPQIFDSLIALKCRLCPFSWQGHQLLASAVNSDWQHIINIRLDAYELLTHNTVDEQSLLFTNFDFFKRVVGKELTKKILEIVS